MGTSRTGKHDRNQARSLEKLVESYIDWPSIEKQLVYRHPEKDLTWAYTGEISVRVASSDGCLE